MVYIIPKNTRYRGRGRYKARLDLVSLFNLELIQDLEIPVNCKLVITADRINGTRRYIGEVKRMAGSDFSYSDFLLFRQLTSCLRYHPDNNTIPRNSMVPNPVASLSCNYGTLVPKDFEFIRMRQSHGALPSQTLFGGTKTFFIKGSDEAFALMSTEVGYHDLIFSLLLRDESEEAVKIYPLHYKPDMLDAARIKYGFPMAWKDVIYAITLGIAPFPFLFDTQDRKVELQRIIRDKKFLKMVGKDTKQLLEIARFLKGGPSEFQTTVSVFLATKKDADLRELLQAEKIWRDLLEEEQIKPKPQRLLLDVVQEEDSDHIGQSLAQGLEYTLNILRSRHPRTEFSYNNMLTILKTDLKETPLSFIECIQSGELPHKIATNSEVGHGSTVLYWRKLVKILSTHHRNYAVIPREVLMAIRTFDPWMQGLMMYMCSFFHETLWMKPLIEVFYSLYQRATSYVIITVKGRRFSRLQKDSCRQRRRHTFIPLTLG